MFGMTRKPTDPWTELLYHLERRMGRMFNDPLATLDWQPGEFTTSWAPVVDIFEEPEVIRIVAEIPGVKPEDVKVHVEGNLLTISGVKEQVAEEKADRVYRYERSYGSFERSFMLPATVEAAGIKATYELGLVTLVLPKMEKAKPRQIKVERGKPETQLQG